MTTSHITTYLLVTQCVLAFSLDYHGQQKVMHQVKTICCWCGDIHNI